MLFPTFTFAIFFLIVYPISWLIWRRPTVWKFFILAASYVFYSFWDWRFSCLILASTVVNSVLARPIQREADSGRRRWLGLALVFNLGLLGVFKYYGFFIEQFNALLRLGAVPFRLPFLEIILPVGISFFTFQAISYVVDIHRRRTQPVSLLDFGVYLAFFPHLVAGPIVRATEFLPQLKLPRVLLRPEASRGAWLIGQGMFKKVVISSFVSTTIVDPVFGVPGQYSSLEILMAIYGYAVQIYADFSGYTDMAIGLALLLGFKFPQNFDQPYTAASIQDFWRRWHMTLSRWLRDYLYIPLGGSRQGRWQTYRNLMLTMILGGLWHGASLTFVAWGFFHGLGLAVERWWSERRGAASHAADRSLAAVWLGRLLTFHFVCALWVLFRADSFATVFTIFERLFTALGPAPLVTPALVAVIFGALALQFIPTTFTDWLRASFSQLPAPVQGVAVGTFIAVCMALGPEGVAPFIYFQF